MATISIRLPMRAPALMGRRALRARMAADAPAVPLVRGERILTIARCRDGAPVVATKLALYHRHPAEPETWMRLGWEQIGHADWNQSHGLVLTGWTPDIPARTVLAVPRGEPLLDLARERVAWTTLLSTRVPVGGSGSARVAARRQPGTGRLLWMVILDPDVPDSAAVRTQLDAALVRLRADLALGPGRFDGTRA